MSNPDHMQKILTSDTCLEKPYILYKHLNLDGSLLASRSSKWKHDRNLFKSSFNALILNSFIPDINKVANETIKELTKEVDGPYFDILNYTTRFALKVICSTSFGIKDLNLIGSEALEKFNYAVN